MFHTQYLILSQVKIYKSNLYNLYTYVTIPGTCLLFLNFGVHDFSPKEGFLVYSRLLNVANVDIWSLTFGGLLFIPDILQIDIFL